MHRCNSQFWLLVAVTFEVTARVVGRLKPYHISRSSHLHIRIWMVLNVVGPARTVPPFVISVASLMKQQPEGRVDLATPGGGSIRPWQAK